MPCSSTVVLGPQLDGARGCWTTVRVPEDTLRGSCADRNLLISQTDAPRVARDPAARPLPYRSRFELRTLARNLAIGGVGVEAARAGAGARVGYGAESGFDATAAFALLEFFEQAAIDAQ